MAEPTTCWCPASHRHKTGGSGCSCCFPTVSVERERDALATLIRRMAAAHHGAQWMAARRAALTIADHDPGWQQTITDTLEQEKP